MNQIPIAYDIPIPGPGTRSSKWDEVFSRLRAKGSFTVKTEADRQSCLKHGKSKKLNLVSRKLNGEGFRIWRVK